MSEKKREPVDPRYAINYPFEGDCTPWGMLPLSKETYNRILGEFADWINPNSFWTRQKEEWGIRE